MGRDFCNETELKAVVSLFQLKRDLDIRPLYTYLCPIIIFVCFFSIIFNAILMSISRQSRAVNKSPILLLSLNLALTDLVASLFNGLGILFNSYLPEVFDRKMPPCAMLTFEVIRCAALIASALHLLALAFVHYRGIVNPLHYRSTIFFSQRLSRSVNVISVCCWIIPLTIMIVWFSSTPCQGFQTAQCDYLFLTQFNFRYMMLTVFSVPLLLMSAIYIRIFLIINRHQKGRRLQHEQSALVCGVVNASGTVGGAAAAVNLPELMLANSNKASGGGVGDSNKVDRCPVCAGHRISLEPPDYYTGENDDDDDDDDEEEDEEDDEEEDDEQEEEEEDADEGHQSDDERSDNDRGPGARAGKRNGRQEGLSVSAPSEELDSSDLSGSEREEEEQAEGRARAHGRAGACERATLICTRAGVLAQRRDEPGGASGASLSLTRSTTDGDASENIPLADDVGARTKGPVGSPVEKTSAGKRRWQQQQQQRPPRRRRRRRPRLRPGRDATGADREPLRTKRSFAPREAGPGDSLRDESGASAAGSGARPPAQWPADECDMNLNKSLARSLDGRPPNETSGPDARTSAGAGQRRPHQRLRLCSSSFAGHRSSGGLASSANSAQSPPGGTLELCTCDNKLKPRLAGAVRLSRANTIGFNNGAKLDAGGGRGVSGSIQERAAHAAATMGTSLRIFRGGGGSSSSDTPGVAVAGPQSSISSAVALPPPTPPPPLRLQLRRSPTSPAGQAAAASERTARDATEGASGRRQLQQEQRRRLARVQAPSSPNADATSVSATTMTSGIPAFAPRPGKPQRKLNNANANGSERPGGNSQSQPHAHGEPQRRHVHASAVPQTNTKALVTTLLILGTYVVSYVPAIAYYALTCIDSPVCPFPLYAIPYGWRVLFGSMTTLLLIAKSIVDPLIYSYRMNEIQVALSRYLSKRRSKSSSHATSLHTSQRFTFNAGGHDNTTHQTTANSSFKILANHNSTRHNSAKYLHHHQPQHGKTTSGQISSRTDNNSKISHKNGYSHETAGSQRAQPDDTTTTPSAAKLLLMQQQQQQQPLVARPLIVTNQCNQGVSTTSAAQVIALDHGDQRTRRAVELVRVDQRRQTAAAAAAASWQPPTCNGRGDEPAARPPAAKRSLKFDKELAREHVDVNSSSSNNNGNSGNSCHANIPARADRAGFEQRNSVASQRAVHHLAAAARDLGG